MSEHHDAARAATQRERDLELDVGRLQAELDTLRGEDPTIATSRFLAMAAATVELAVADARREADEIVEEVSSQAEARRDEATRVAAEAEALAELKLAEADRSQDLIDDAQDEAASIRVAAKAEADELIAVERTRVADEISALAEVRDLLETEREGLESYHEELRRRVQELAESMVSFMTTQSPLGAASAIEGLLPPQLEAVLAETSERERNEREESIGDDATAEGRVEGIGSAVAVDPQIVDVPDTSIDEVLESQVAWFGGARVVDQDDGAPIGVAADLPRSAGLFARSEVDEEDLDNPVAEDVDFDGAAEDGDPSSFAALGVRVVAQAEGDEPADVLDSDALDDQAFRQFLDGDDAPDPSRDWLLRPEQS